MSDVNLVLALVGGAILALSLTADLIRGQAHALAEPVLATGFGILIGPVALDLLDPADWGDPLTILEHAARFALALALMGAALRLPQRYFFKCAAPMAAILGPGMLTMWIVSGLLAWAVLGVPFWIGMLLGAVVTPTDPIVSGAIVTGSAAERNLPPRIRNALTAESGANDGAAYLLVFLPILLLGQPPGPALKHWVGSTLAWEILAAVVFGAAIGYGVGWLQRWTEKLGIARGQALLAISSALALFLLGTVRLAGSDGLLAVFVAGLAFSWIVRPERTTQQGEVQETIKRLFTVPVFILFGATLPWPQWWALGWTGIGLAAAVLALRRLPMLAIIAPLMRPALRGRRDVLFYGWFGPIGIAAIFYATLATRHTGLEIVWSAGSLVVAASILAHGITATPLTHLYGRRARRDEEGSG